MDREHRRQATEAGTDHVALVLELFRAIEDRDEARLFELYHPEVEFVWPPELPGYGGTYRGAELAAMHEAFDAAWAPLQSHEELQRLDPRVVAAGDDEVVVHYHQRGVDQAGRRCDAEVLACYRVRDGRIAHLQMFYFDPASVRDFLLGAGTVAEATPGIATG